MTVTHEQNVARAAERGYPHRTETFGINNERRTAIRNEAYRLQSLTDDPAIRTALARIVLDCHAAQGALSTAGPDADAISRLLDLELPE